MSLKTINQLGLKRETEYFYGTVGIKFVPSFTSENKNAGLRDDNAL
jgi:hypothetical protein